LYVDRVSRSAALTSQRDLFSPKRAEGPWTRSLEDGTWRRGVVPTATPKPKAKAVEGPAAPPVPEAS
jgi:hypothetical protein